MKERSALPTTCDALRTVLADAIASTYPDVSISCEVQPHVDIASADFESSCLRQLAAAVSLAPHALLARIAGALPPDCAERLTVANGLLLYHGPSQFEWLLENDATISFSPSEMRIVISLPLEEQSKWGYLRLCAYGLLQAELRIALGWPTTVCLGDEGRLLHPFPGTASALAACETLFDSSKVSDEFEAVAALSHALADTVAFDGGANSARQIVWVPPQILKLRQLRERLNVTERRVQIICPGQASMFDSCKTDLREAELRKTDLFLPDGRFSRYTERAVTENLVWYLAGGPPLGRDLDLHVPALEEKANVRWYAAMTRRRLADVLQCVDGAASGGGEGIKHSADPCLVRQLLARCRYVHYFMQRAAYAGDVRSYLTVLKDLLSCAHRLLNTPSFRQQLLHGEGVWLVRHVDAALKGCAIEPACD